MSTILDVKYDGKKEYEIVIESSFDSFLNYFKRIGNIEEDSGKKTVIMV